ncbi:carboxymuconolactone decarboxylase family protein [Planosporangium sp. 12N6]|uniref:carboxymuconolactone decarboxylase family protein n=1 Tax=Planosporangium spinosum TaxID=3402278 RepID=UPI003CECCA45
MPAPPFGSENRGDTDVTDRYARGLELLETIHGPEAATAIRESFDAVHPGFGRYTIGAGFRRCVRPCGVEPGATATAERGRTNRAGSRRATVRGASAGCANVGVSAGEILETVFHAALYAGHPRSVNALRVAGDVFTERG